MRTTKRRTKEEAKAIRDEFAKLYPDVVAAKCKVSLAKQEQMIGDHSQMMYTHDLIMAS